ncbi:MMPL family transporter [Rhodocytophaga aerolata]|uniref:MMPL family transporter n=1 Tax=Rhodocytophaga aerolata TaxID=455078 RepID=A0ABT8R8V4_9BACT|nr:MMPL family transporter [Rhodocytophaga aerolata]MDO1448515.1 MMPL family transporter [Rhodocytophaga aerolata]
MWTRLAHIILKYRLTLILIIGVLTICMGLLGRKAEMSYDFAAVVPKEDPDFIYFQQFKKQFGEDSNILAIGMQDSQVYALRNFIELKTLSDQIAGQTGIVTVLSLPRLQYLAKDTATRKLIPRPLFSPLPQNQAELDSLLAEANKLEFYKGQVINQQTGATILLVAIEKSMLNSENRIGLVNEIEKLGEQFTQQTGIRLHYAGVPYVRTIMTTQVKAELSRFLVFSLVITALILFIFFRSFYAVFFPLIVVGVVVVWVLGTIVLFGYKITLLTGLLPSIIVVIGIPNCIYLLTKYHQEIRAHGNKIKALSRIIRKIGIVTLMTNATTAIGFIVLGFANISILREFGIIAGINILNTFLISLILIPAVFSYLPSPTARQTRHLDARMLNGVLRFFHHSIHHNRVAIYVFTSLVVVVSLAGVLKIKALAYMVDDLPETSSVKKDLAFFEANFKGIMPLEIVVDTGKKRGVLRLENLKQIESLEDTLARIPALSKPVSVVSFVKASTQAFFNGNTQYYRLPTNQEKNFLLRYLSNQDDQSGLLKSFVDSTGQVVRISVKIADMGSIKMDSLVKHEINPKLQATLAGTAMKAYVTGTTLLFIKGNDYLIKNLQSSLLIAFVLIACIMAILFKSPRMIIISLIPNIIPLLITGGLMGYFNIPLKPSTALIFSIAFGISVDDTIHFLAKYRQELLLHKLNVPKAVSASLFETGSSMIYTSIILFSGFIIFAGSDFGGTVALGFLTSSTLLCAMFTNLILLPSLLISFDTGKIKKGEYGWIEEYNEFYLEDEDEEIDLSLLGVKAGKSA